MRMRNTLEIVISVETYKQELITSMRATYIKKVQSGTVDLYDELITSRLWLRGVGRKAHLRGVGIFIDNKSAHDDLLLKDDKGVRYEWRTW